MAHTTGCYKIVTNYSILNMVVNKHFILLCLIEEICECPRQPKTLQNKKPKGNNRSPDSQQVQSLDKVFFFPYMRMTVILVKFQAYGCNGFHRIIGPVNAYPRPSCHFFPCFHVCLCFQNRPLPTLITYLHLLYQLFASITFQFSGCNSFQKITF